MPDSEDAINASYGGSVRQMVDLTRTLIAENGFLRGMVRTISEGLLGMPLSFQGPPEMVKDLINAAETPGEWARMHPLNEVSQIIDDGIVFNLGLGQYVFDEPELVRPIGYHRIPRLEWRDPRWLRQDTTTRQWYYQGLGGEVPISPGDGEWLLFQPYPRLDAWRHAPAVYIMLAAIFGRDALFDRQRTSEVSAPTRVARAIKAVSPKTLSRMASDLAKMAHDNEITLPAEWIYEIVSASAGDYWKVCAEIVTWARQNVEVGLTGNILSVEGPTGFANAGFYVRVNMSRRQYYADTWCDCARTQGLVWWVRDNWGEQWVSRCPVPVYNVRDPKDAADEANVLKSFGEGLEKLASGISAAGLDLDRTGVMEMLQRYGIRTTPKATGSAVAKLPLGVDAIGAVVRGGVALASLGLAPFGDERDNMTIAELAERAKGGAAPAPTPASSSPPAPASPPAAREADDECDPDEDDCDESARLAEAYTARALDRCPYHGRTHSCPRCGVRRVYALDEQTGQPRIQWRAIRKPAQAVAA
jgi:hypothetical protein